MRSHLRPMVVHWLSMGRPVCVPWLSHLRPMVVLFLVRTRPIGPLTRLYQRGFGHDLEEKIFVNTVHLPVCSYLVVLLPVEDIGHQILVEHFDKALRCEELEIILRGVDHLHDWIRLDDAVVICCHAEVEIERLR